jgi:hypothetical protein
MPRIKTPEFHLPPGCVVGIGATIVGFCIIAGMRGQSPIDLFNSSAGPQNNIPSQIVDSSSGCPELDAPANWNTRTDLINEIDGIPFCSNGHIMEKALTIEPNGSLEIDYLQISENSPESTTFNRNATPGSKAIIPSTGQIEKEIENASDKKTKCIPFKKIQINISNPAPEGLFHIFARCTLDGKIFPDLPLINEGKNEEGKYIMSWNLEALYK